MSGSYVLLQYGSEAWPATFEDIESRLAFTITQVEENPNLLLKLVREGPWAQQHPGIMGPSSSFFYFGPFRTPGYIVYGNNPTQPMVNSIKAKRDPAVRCFVAQNGKEYKWKLSPERLECLDSRNTSIAIWELAKSSDPFHARLTIKHTALPIVTELLTTLTLNRIAQKSNW